MASILKFFSFLFIINASSLVLTTCGAAPTHSPTIHSHKAAILSGLDTMRHFFIQRPWILDVYNHIALSPSDRQVFSKTLQGVSAVGSQMRNGAAGSWSNGVAVLIEDYKGHKASDVVAKAMMEPFENGYAEVKALRTFSDLYIDSGMVSGWPSANPSPVLLMKKVPGQPIRSCREYRMASTEQRTAIHTTLQKMVCSQVVKWALEHRLLFADLHQGNIMVVMEGTTVKSMQIIDFGYPGIFTVTANAKEDDIQSWCLARFADKWVM
ncbi:hypothetical protein D9757_013220 [Collybiopsis confluens]|uniref:ABC1 atypical kinase-like domain-containing protein n=1 Tax=Collybiopsis confluens TaxID=2823264 RepID=A0A8H5GAA6_9AGAR|nr:hypothetical protein D9757_013220 [Collybiopsis confluens]